MRVYWCVCLDNGCYLIRGLNLLQAEGEKKNNNNKKAIDAKQLPGEQRMY